MSLPASIAKNTLIQITGKAAGALISLLTVGLITRSLGQIGFGYYTTIFAFLQVFGILVDFGLQTTTITLISDPKYQESKMLSNILGLRLVSSLSFLALAPSIAIFFPYPSEIKTGIAIGAIFFVFLSLISVLTALFQKHLVMKYVTAADLAGKLILLALTWAAVLSSGRLAFILLASVLAGFLHFIILWAFAKKFSSPSFSFDFAVFREIIKKTYPIAITIALNLVYFKSDIIILSLFRTPAEVGLYGAPYKVLEVLINIVYLFLGLLLPLMAHAYATKNLESLKKTLQQGFDAISIFALPMIFGTLILGRPLMTLVAGNEFAVSGDILKILIFATASIFYASLFGYAIIALNRQKKMIIFYGINAFLSLTLYLFFIPLYGFWAAAILTVFTEIFILVSTYAIMRKYLAFFPKFSMFRKALLASIIMTVLLYVMKDVHVIAAGGAGAIIYLLIIFLFGDIKMKAG